MSRNAATNDGSDDGPPITFHMAPADVWRAQSGLPAYLPEAFAADGFIHCTDGEDELIAVANHFYRSDARDYVVLSIARDRIAAPVRYKDPSLIYPHIYGPLNVDAVESVRPMLRDADGRFLGVRG